MIGTTIKTSSYDTASTDGESYSALSFDSPKFEKMNNHGMTITTKKVTDEETASVTSMNTAYIYDGNGEVDDPSVTSVVVKEGVKVIPNDAFLYCTSLKDVQLPESLQEIGERAFSYCLSLETVDIPQFVKVIQAHAFHGCSSLKYVKFPDSLDDIREGAFSFCESLEEVDIPQSVKFIARGVFSMCTSLHYVQVPENLKFVSHNSFKGCSSLKILSNGPLIEEKEENVPEDGDKKIVTQAPRLATVACVQDGDKKTVTQAPRRATVDSFPVKKLNDHFQDLPLHRVCYQQDVSLSKIQSFFIDSKDIYDDLGKVDHRDRTALHILAGNAHATSQMLEFLVKRRPDISHAVDQNGRTFLHYACVNVKAFPVSPYLLNLKNSTGDFLVSKKDVQQDNVTTLANRYMKESSFDKKMLLFCLQPVTEFAGKSEMEGALIKNMIKRRIDYQTKEVDFKTYSALQKHGLVQFFGHLRDDDIIQVWVSLIQKFSRKTVKMISEFTDSKGRKLHSAVHLDIRNAIYDKILFVRKYKLVDRPLIYQSENTLVLEGLDYRPQEHYSYLYKQYADKGTNCITEDKFKKVMVELVHNSDEDNQIEEFEKWDIDNNGQISEENFIRFCNATLKEFPVALKFMKKKHHFQQEIAVRDTLYSDSSFQSIVEILQDYSSEKDSDFKNQKDEYLRGYKDGNQFNYMLVMPKGERTLDTICRFEMPNSDEIKGYVKDMCDAIQVLHENDRIHGDIKPQNFIRMQQKLYMINLDTSCITGQGERPEQVNYFGKKFSSGILPPEMICCMRGKKKNDYLKYFENTKNDDDKFWKKIQPLYHQEEKCHFTVKIFLEDNDGKIQDIRKLPYTPIKANKSIDLWSLGVVLYKVLSGLSLFDTDKNEDLTSPTGFRDICFWDDTKRDDKLLDIKDLKARSLLRTLLSRNPEHRGSIQDVMNHPYIDSTKPFAVKIVGEIHNRTYNLCKTIFQATDIDIPTCFLFTDQELVTSSENNYTFMKVILEKLDEYANNAEDKWEAIKNLLVNPTPFLQLLVEEYTVHRGTYYLYFVDEYTCEPIILERENYPLKIRLFEKPEIFHVLLMGMMNLFITNKCARNLLKGSEMTTTTFDTLECFEANKDIKVEGHQLQNFKDLILREDKSDLCDLCRVYDDYGNVIWTRPEYVDQLQKNEEQVKNTSTTLLNHKKWWETTWKRLSCKKNGFI